jgi:hypothetical protein
MTILKAFFSLTARSDSGEKDWHLKWVAMRPPVDGGVKARDFG